MAYELVTLSRSIEAIEVPSGYPITLESGSQVRITQALGGSYTVTTDWGGLARVNDRDADALGKEAANNASGADDERPLEEKVWEQLRSCYDPEIPVNIVDLGLVYDCKVEPLPDGGNKIAVVMTLTAPGCGMGEVLRSDVQRRVLSLPEVKDADIQLVIDPPWDQSRMSEAAKLQLGLL